MINFFELRAVWFEKNYHVNEFTYKKNFYMLMTGIEPATVGLLDQCSTD